MHPIRPLLISTGSALMMLCIPGASTAQHFKAVKEFRYPTAFETQPITIIVNGRAVVIGQSVTPSEFATREVGVVLDIHQVFVHSLGDIGIVMNGVGDGDLRGNTPLMLAASGGDVAGVRKLLRRGASVHKRNIHGSTALMGAAAGGHLTIVRMLLDRGAHASSSSKSGYTALMFAAKNGHLDVVETLLSRGVAVDNRDVNGDTALMYAVHEGHPDIVKQLIQSGATAQLTDRSGVSALALAKADDDRDMIVLLTTPQAPRR
ncbi:MAG: ankyrin repeat domain-containing protein [Verrucomicrobia bacterium]|nr:ankyrin repeat domain-containing protein [Verrucomicrobiota bacterium]MDA1087463.1 ankyrin repeat domain-containing protein [Verrucomicrobiota bacterium]